MALRQIFLTTTWAAGAFAVALAVGQPMTLNAVDQPNPTPLAEKIQFPTLKVNGIEIYAEVVGADSANKEGNVQPEQPLSLKIHAMNKGTAAASADISLSLASADVRSMVSRVPSMPKEFWRQELSLKVAPGESKTETVSTAAIPAKRIITGLIVSRDQTIQMFSLTPWQSKNDLLVIPVNIKPALVKTAAANSPTTQPVSSLMSEDDNP